MIVTIKQIISPQNFFYSKHYCHDLIFVLIVTALLSVFPRESYAVFNENVAISAKAIALGNAVTADPPGLMSAHYNPAGLALLPEGTTHSQGLALIHLTRTARFEEDPDWPGLMNGQWGPDPEKWPDTYNKADDPNSDHGGPDPLAGTEGTNSSGQMYLPFIGPIPFLGGPTLGISSRKPGSKWTFAYANYAPYGGGMINDEKDNPLRFGSKSFYLQHLIYAAPSVAYQISDTLSVGLSVGMGQRAFGLEVDIRAPNEMVALTRVIGDATRDLNIPVISDQTLPGPWLGGGQGPYEHAITLKLDDLRDDFATSFNLGLLWRPRNWFSFGVVYQSESVAELTGKYEWKYSDQYRRTVDWNGKTEMTLQSAGMLDLPFSSVATQTGTVTSTDITPQRLQTGVMVKPFQRMKLLFDISWANWSVIKQQVFTFDQRIQLLRTAKLLGYPHGAYDFVVDRNMKDTWHWGTGLEFAVTDNFSLRMGYERRPTSQQKDRMDTLMFLPDATLYGAGFEVKLPKDTTVEISMGYLLTDHLKIDNNESTNLNSNDFTKLGNPYAGLDYEQDAAIYVFSIGVTMPLEVQMEMVHHQVEMVKHQISAVKHLFGKLNPFKKEKHETNEIPH